MKEVLKRGSAVLIILLMFGACDDSTSPSGTPSGNIVEITGNIETPTTWSGDTIYVIRKYDFYVSSILSIQPGTIVKFHPSDGPYCMLGSEGVIVAQGTSSNPIVFTSYLDDEHGGDTNGDSTATQPASRDWGCINTNGMNGSTFEYCKFFYGGDVLYNATLILYGDNITVTECLFAHNDGSFSSSAGGIGVLDASDASAGTVIRNNVFFDNIRPLSISTEFDLDDSNTFHDPADPTVVNLFNAVFVNTIEDIDSPITWQETEVPFAIDDNDFWIESGYSLTFGNDVVLKFKSGSTMVLADGESALVNHNGTGVWFTSWRDDTHKGDTNGDGSATAPSSGDWGGIYDDSGAIPYPYYFGWSNILYDSY